MYDFLIKDFISYLRPIIEIGVLSFIIYAVMHFLRGTRAANIMSGLVLLLIILKFSSDYLELEVISWLLNFLMGALTTALIVIFQPELRRGFARIGSNRFFHRKIKKQEALNEAIIAVQNMARKKIGALLVFERGEKMTAVLNDAVKLNSTINSQLLESIFQPDTPLHDGAVIIRRNRIIAAHAILPLSHDEEMIKMLGTRHRASLGITTESDAVSVVVSEETGKISVAARGKIKYDIDPGKLSRYLSTLIITDEYDIKETFAEIDEDTEIISGFSTGGDDDE